MWGALVEEQPAQAIAMIRDSWARTDPP